MNTITLDPQFRVAVSNLVLDAHTSAGLLSVPDEAVQAVREGLEQALADPDSMCSYLTYLNSLNVRHPFKYHELMDAERQDRVLEEGMGCLDAHELAVLALNPLQLLDLRDELFQTNVTCHWWAILLRFNPEAAAIGDAGSEDEADNSVTLAGLSRDEQEQSLAGAYFGEQASQQVTAPEAEPRDLWTVSLALEPPSVEWLEVADSLRREADSKKTVEIVFAWYRQRTPSELEVRLGSPLLLTSRSTCSARLLDSTGHPTSTAEVQAPKLHFVLTEDDLSRSATLELDYSQVGRYRLRLQLALSRPSGAALRSDSLSMTELALRGRTTELEREFRSCLPALLDRVNVPLRERSDAFCDALVALVVKNSRNLEGRRFRECLPAWIEEFLSQRGITGVERLEDADWEAVLTEVATNQALARVEEALQPKLPSWFTDFARMVKEKPLGDRIPFRGTPVDMSEYAEFASCRRVFDQEAVTAYRQLTRFWELN